MRQKRFLFFPDDHSILFKKGSHQFKKIEEPEVDCESVLIIPHTGSHYLCALAWKLSKPAWKY